MKDEHGREYFRCYGCGMKIYFDSEVLHACTGRSKAFRSVFQTGQVGSFRKLTAFALLALCSLVHADTIPDWLRHPASVCSSTQVVRYATAGARATCGSVAYSELTGTPTTLAGYGITDAQARVSGTCAVGNAIRAIAADGTVTCQSASGGGGGTWGSITGTLSAQTDLQAALDAKQPLDSDLTAIAALTTTSYGRGFLPLADAAAGRTYLGLGTLATQSGTFSGTSSGTNTGDQTNITGNAGTASALAANPADCAANNYATTIAANGDLTCAQVAYTQVTGTPSLAAVATTGAYSDLSGAPTLPANTTSTAHQWFDAYNSTTGAFTKAQPACTDLSDAGTGCTATIANYLTTTSAASTYVPQTTTVAGHALSGNVTVSASDVGLGSVTNDAQTKAAIVPNTAPSAGQILVGNAGGTAYAPVTLSGSGATATMSSAGVITLSAIANASLSNSSVTVAGHSIALGGSSAIACGDLSNGASGCSTATGTSGATIPLLNGANTWSGVQSVNSGDLALKGATSGTITLNAAATAGSSTITLPAGTTDFSSTGGTSQVVQQTSSGGAFTVGQLAASNLSDGTTGSGGGVVLATGPTMTNPVVGTQSAGDNSTKAASTAFLQKTILGMSPTVPLAASFSTFGSQITATDKSDRMQFIVTGAAGTLLNGITQNSISTPYTVDMCGNFVAVPASTSSAWFGLALSDGTKYRTLYVGITNTTTQTAASWQYAVDSWTNATAFSAHVSTTTVVLNNPFCLRITDNGTTRTLLAAQNGRDYVTLYSEATNTFLTPTKFAVVLYNAGGATVTAKGAITHFLVTNSVLGDGS